MDPKNKRRFRIFFISLHLLILAVFLSVCLVPFVDPVTFWFIGVLGTFYPILLGLMLLVFVILIVMRSKWALVSLAALLISWQQISVVFRPRGEAAFGAKQPAHLRVLTWNVSGWTGTRTASAKKPGAEGYWPQVLRAIGDADADVVCLQEFLESYTPKLMAPNLPVLQQMGYRYHYFTPTVGVYNKMFRMGLITLSRFPIIDSAYFGIITGNGKRGFHYIDISMEGQPVRIFNTQLESVGLSRSDYQVLGKTETPRSVLGKMKRSYYYRSAQADAFRAEMDRSSHPIILCGDLNDVPNSYTYFRTKGKMKDAFLGKGSGLGRTFKFISPTLRIDYLMTDPRFGIEQFARLDHNFSDHYPLVMDITLNK